MKILGRTNEGGVSNKRFKFSNQLYSKRLSFYNVPPVDDITLEEIERFAIDRLKVLKEIDTSRIRGLDAEQYNNRMREVLNKYLPLPHSTFEMYESIRKDVISHYILRLAYCKPDERKWFIKQEKELLNLRLCDTNTVKTFEIENGIHYDEVSIHEFNLVKEDLKQMFRWEYNTRNEALFPKDMEDNKSYVKVSFEEVLDLVSKRRVVVSHGFAYVHKSKVKYLILTEFRKRLELAVIRTYEQAPLWRDDKRIFDLIESLPSQYLEHEYVPMTKNEIDISQLDTLSLRSMPLCMQYLHNNLKRYHHLKHLGRLQYGLFLKGIGVSLKQALLFWESEFTKAGLNFEKDYSYNVKHNYGTVGKRTSYCPYSCTKIINMPVVSEEHHGCPYKRADKTYLRKLLMDNSLDHNDIENVLKISTQSPMEACREVFMLSHPGYQIEEIIHPNKYFDASMDYYQQKEKFMNQQPSQTNVANPHIKNVTIY